VVDVCVGVDTKKYNPIAKAAGDNFKFMDPGLAAGYAIEKRGRDIQQAKVPQPAQPDYDSTDYDSTGSTVLTNAPPPKATGSTYLGGM
jgi:hypothetical protein